MTVRVEWESRYRYPGEVRQLHVELRVAPRDGGVEETQRVVSSALRVAPEARLTQRRDLFGNVVHHFDILGRVEELELSLGAEVETVAGPTREPELTPLVRALALAPTARCPDDPAVRQLAAGVGDGTPLELATRLMEAIGTRVRFEVGHTTVESTAVDALRHGHGVCQDFAHLLIAALRVRGVPALYVSGYLSPEAGVASDEASHAWMQLYAEGAWHGLDAANATEQDRHYVVTAVGRDYDDVPPVRGSFRGLAEQEWHARVRVHSDSDPNAGGQ